MRYPVLLLTLLLSGVAVAADPSERPPGLTPAWRQIVDLANRLGAGWDYTSSAEVMREIGRAVPAYGAAGYDNLARDYGRQWPCTTDKPLGTRFLCEEGIVGQPFSLAPIPRPSRPPCASLDYPFTLSFGHSLYYWHQNVLIKHSETLKREYHILLLDYPDGFVHLAIQRQEADEVFETDIETDNWRKTAKSVLGVKAYQTVLQIPDEVDLAILIIPALAVPAVLPVVLAGAVVHLEHHVHPAAVVLHRVHAVLGHADHFFPVALEAGAHGAHLVVKAARFNDLHCFSHVGAHAFSFIKRKYR